MRVFMTVLLALAFALAGCASDPAEPASDDLSTEEVTEPEDEGTTTEGEADPEAPATSDSETEATAENLAPDAAIEVDASEVEPGTEVELVLNASDPEDGPLDWALLVDGEEAATGTEEDLPFSYIAVFEDEGEHEVAFTVDDGEHQVTETATIVVALPPEPELETIVIEGTVTGVPEAGMKETETFELVAPPAKMTLTFEQGPTATDLDFYLYDPAGNEAGRSASFEALGSGNEEPIEVAGAAVGEWTLDVVGYLAVEGAYTITITFE